MNHYPIILTLLVSAATLFISSCNDKRAAHTNIIAEWVGREIVMPDDLVYQIQDDTIDLDLSRPDFKIINYIDSTGCTSCRMKLTMWSDLINELKSLPDVDVEVIMIVNSIDSKEIVNILHRDNYLNPIVIDRDNLFDSLNDLPPKSEHHTFLLDAENKVIAVGNPVFNPKIRDLFLRQIVEYADLRYEYDHCCIHAHQLGLINAHETITKDFYFENHDTISYTLQAVIPSCNCISATTDFTALSPGECGNVILNYNADSILGSFNQHVDIFFNEKEHPERLTVYGYIK
ncbi:MAG: DUF1573 domain-containing protein [Muribaculaceae bacterium]|nr:DUF1573 domain-containing protein [Muribaculaceae bacterium]